MQKISVSEILKENESCYSFVVAVAKRAREIAEDAEEKGEILIEKPVQLAIKDFADGKCALKQRDNIGDTIE